MTARSVVFALMGAGAVFWAPMARAGTYIEEAHTMVSGGQTNIVTVKTWVEGDQVRMDDPRSGGVLLLNTRAGSVVGVHPNDKTWWRLKEGDLKAFGVATLMAYGIRTDQAGKLQVPQNIFQKTGKTKKVGSLVAHEVKVNIESPNPQVKGFKSTLWFADVKGYEPALQRNRIRMLIGEGPEAEAFLKQWDALDGVPVLTEMTLPIGPQTVQMSQEVKKVAEQKTRAEDMQVPQGFKQVEDPFTQMKRQMPQGAPGMPGGQSPPPMQ
jgi:hypothetical protein